MYTDVRSLCVIATGVVFAVALFGFFWTKKEGFGKYTTAALLFILVLFIGSESFFLGLIDGPNFVNLLAAVAGFAGGLFAARDAD